MVQTGSSVRGHTPPHPLKNEPGAGVALNETRPLGTPPLQPSTEPVVHESPPPSTVPAPVSRSWIVTSYTLGAKTGRTSVGPATGKVQLGLVPQSFPQPRKSDSASGRGGEGHLPGRRRARHREVAGPGAAGAVDAAAPHAAAAPADGEDRQRPARGGEVRDQRAVPVRGEGAGRGPGTFLGRPPGEPPPRVRPRRERHRLGREGRERAEAARPRARQQPRGVGVDGPAPRQHDRDLGERRHERRAREPPAVHREDAICRPVAVVHPAGEPGARRGLRVQRDDRRRARGGEARDAPPVAAAHERPSPAFAVTVPRPGPPTSVPSRTVAGPVGLLAANAAVTDLATSIVTRHGSSPLQPPPDQPANTAPATGVAASVTRVPGA